MKSMNYSTFQNEFLRHAERLLKDLVPEKIHLAKKDIKSYLKSEKARLRRWFKALQKNHLNAEEFGKLFNALYKSFQLGSLQKEGLEEVLIRQLSNLLRKLFRAITLMAVKGGSLQAIEEGLCRSAKDTRNT